jgi:hypothetical protein
VPVFEICLEKAEAVKLAKEIKLGLDHIVLDPRDMIERGNWRWIMTLQHFEIG